MSFLGKLVERSSLTSRQFESIVTYARVSSGGIKLKEAASLATPGKRKGSPEKPLSIGSYYRTVLQARENVKEALATVVIALWLGVIKVEDARRLFELVGSGERGLTNEEGERFVQVLGNILDRIAM